MSLLMQETQEMWVRSLGQEDALEEGMATHSNILAWESHGQRSLAGCNLWGHDWSDLSHMHRGVVRFCFFIEVSWHECMPSHFSHVPLFATPWTVTCQAPLSMRFPRHKYWNGLPWCPPGRFLYTFLYQENPCTCHDRNVLRILEECIQILTVDITGQWDFK